MLERLRAHSAERAAAMIGANGAAAAARRQPLAYVCDPVLGDHGKLYVPRELVDVYRREVIRCATVLTPNQVRPPCRVACSFKTNKKPSI